MGKKYSFKTLLFVSIALSFFIVSSCKKENKQAQIKPVNIDPVPTKFGLYEAKSSIYKLLYTYVSKIGALDVKSSDYDLVFDTGSGGLVIDAYGILPSSMITNSGFIFTGDSTIVGDITIYNQQAIIEYGDDISTTSKVYGNLAYASVTIGDDNANIIIKRLPFFLYYKAIDGTGAKFAPHEFDILGVSPQYDVIFPNGVHITSPFSYFEPGTGLTKGMKMAAANINNFSDQGTYVPDAVTLGLTSFDLFSGGFHMSPLTYNSRYGYAPIIPISLTYNNKAISTYAVFDTGTEPYSYIEDNTATNTSPLLLPSNSMVSLGITSGFNYSYTITPTENLTFVENPIASQTDISILGLEFFLNNEYLLDYTNHQIGLKNN